MLKLKLKKQIKPNSEDENMPTSTSPDPEPDAPKPKQSARPVATEPKQSARPAATEPDAPKPKPRSVRGAPYPSVSNIADVNHSLKFTLIGDISIVNGLRRTIMTDIPVCGMRGFPHDMCKINAKVNQCHLNNEIVKHRLSCIPIMLGPRDTTAVNNRQVVIHVKNTSETTRIVTTKDIRIYDKSKNDFLPESVARAMFPPCPLTNMYIDILRLQPNIIPSGSGEEIHIVADLSIITAKIDSVFNATSTCCYGKTPNEKLLREAWSASNEDESNRADWFILNKEKYATQDSYDFVVETACYFDNRSIMVEACDVLCQNISKCVEELAKDESRILYTQRVSKHCYEISLVNDDYTVGKILERGLFTKYFPSVITFCSYQKYPSQLNALLTISLTDQKDRTFVLTCLDETARSAVEQIIEIRRAFAN